MNASMASDMASGLVASVDEPADALDLSTDLPEPLRGAALRLSELLTHEDLVRLLDARLVAGFRSLARTALGRTPRLGKESLAAALLLRHGLELFGDKRLRDRVARRLRLASPGRWHPGRPAALRFVRAAGFDDALAGAPPERSPDDVEWFSGRLTLAPLADFQEEVLQKCGQFLDQASRVRRRVIVTLPTGGGKTRVAAEYLTRFAAQADCQRGRVVLWIAHTEELLEQAVESIRQVWRETAAAPPARLDRRFGRHGRSESADEEFLSAGYGDPQLVVATPQRMLNDFDRWREDRAEDLADWCRRVGLIVVDEAHRAAAPQYRKLLEFFAEMTRRHGVPQPRVLGLTATPFRAEYHSQYPELGTRDLKKLFVTIIDPDETLGDNPRETLQQRRVLASPSEQRIETHRYMRIADLLTPGSEPPESAALETVDRRLMERADEATRRALVFRHLLPLVQGSGHRVLYFGPSVDDAELVCFMLRSQGVPAAFISGDSRRVQRRASIDAFRSGQVRVLCNCEVLTTGFDAPQITHVVIARPTVSHVLFEQMVGRGLRGPAFGGTETCEIVYFVDRMDVDQPRLGYQAWRAIWGLQRAGEPAG